MSNNLEFKLLYMNEKNISFIIPAYNCAKTIEESILSIVGGNSFSGDEIVICDDGSSDNTLEILNDLNKKFQFIKIIKHEQNKGGATARNTAVKNSKNELIFCLDSDNVLAPGSVEKLKNFLIDNNADVASFQELRYFNDNIRKISHKWIFPEGTFTLADHLAGCVSPGASGNYLFTKDIWEKSGGYPEFAKSLDAWGFGFRQLAVEAKMVVLPKSYYFHRYGHESYWVRESKNNLSEIALKIIEPYKSVIEYNDWIYMESGDWFGNIDKRPIKLKSQNLGKAGRTVFNWNLLNLLKGLVGKIKNKIKWQ